MYIIVKCPAQMLLWGDHGHTRFWNREGYWQHEIGRACHFETRQSAEEYAKLVTPSDPEITVQVLHLDAIPPWV